MNQLEVFFDYTCPFCLKGHQYLMELLPRYPKVDILWRPCEAHPRPEQYGLHSDLCIQGMFFAADQGISLLAYQERMYELALKRRVNIEDIDILTDNIGDLLDADTFRSALKSGKYKEIQENSNINAFERSGVWAVPSYRMNGAKLDSVEGFGVTKSQLAAFLEKAN
jgi:predicted DsbA family dithiol-disulfide isomerase